VGSKLQPMRFPSRAYRSVTALLALALGASMALGAAPHDKAVRRCGWFDNPTPGNAWLTDRDGEWIVGTQGGHQADGDWPEFSRREWVRSNGSYGHGCACITLVANSEKEVLRIVSAGARPLQACRRDGALQEPGP
jgi:hypothetical protein